MKNNRSGPSDARGAALEIVTRVIEERQALDEGFVANGLDPADRARALRLATDCLRWADRADRMLGPYLRLKPYPIVLNLLRLGVLELCQYRGAPHGVVNAMVSLAKSREDTRRAAGLVNAVLRKVAKDCEKWDGLPLPRMPKWLRRPVVAAWGKGVADEIERSHAAGAALDLTPRDGDGAGLAEMLGGTLLPTGSVRLDRPGQISALAGYDDGAWWVQDAAAALPARILAPQPGEKVLDMCAAPGGKTLQLAAAGADVTALDISADRLGVVRENLARTGLYATCVAADALTFEAPPFDAILLDAPCSATGTIRRHPDLPFLKDGSGIAAMAQLQADLLDRAVGLLRPGGRLVFCTCSLLPQEGEDQAAAALLRHPGLRADPDALRQDGVEASWIDETGLRLRPDYWSELGGMDGFFIAAFRVAG